MILLFNQINYIGASAIFSIGLYMVLVQGNLVRKIIGINLMETSVFLIFVTIGFVRGANAPVVSANPESGYYGTYINPLPSALILTGIVVALSITVFALSLVIRIHKTYGTVETDRILEIRRKEADD